MEFDEVVRARRMVRRFRSDALDVATIGRLRDLAGRAPTAGNARGVDVLVLEGERTDLLWRAIGDDVWLASGASRALRQAPVLFLPVADPARYVARYRAADKKGSLLSDLDPDDWPVPYWTVDASFAAMTLLLAAEDAGCGALFFHLRGRENAVRRALDLADRVVLIGAIAVGRPDATPQPR